MSEVKEIVTSQFDAEIAKSTIPVLVDFWAEWCVPCKQLAPLLDELAIEYDEQMKFVKMNADESGDIFTQFGVVGIPTLLIFKDGVPIAQKSGAMPKSTLNDWIKQTLAGM